MRSLLGVSMLTGVAIAINSASLAAAPRHYDCTKAGNANKAVCKAGAVSPAAPAAVAPTAPAAATPVKAAWTYDCSKAGNKNKAACKTSVAAAPPAPARPAAAPASPVLRPTVAAEAPAAAPASAASPRIVAWTEKNGKVVHYDCSKAGNFSKKACKS